MDGAFILDSMEFLDADLIEAAGMAAPRKGKRWIGWAAAAACLCLLVGGGLLLGGRESASSGMQTWSASMSARDYFKNCGGEDELPGPAFSDSLAMPPYAAALTLDGQREELEEAGVLPTVPDHPAQRFHAYFNGDGSLYKVTFWWMLRPFDETGGYSDLRLTAAPKELHEVSDTVFIRLDENGKEIPPRVTVTERDGITILGKGGEREAKTLTWQTGDVWYQLYGDPDMVEEMVALLDWFWAHPLSLDRFRDLAGECFVYSTREEKPEAFREEIPDFEALGYTAEYERMNLARRDGEYLPARFDGPVWFEGVYVRGQTRIRWTLSLGADADAWDACIGSPGEVTEEQLAAALMEKDYVNLYLYEGLYCMVTLRLEQGTSADAWEIVQSMQD